MTSPNVDCSGPMKLIHEGEPKVPPDWSELSDFGVYTMLPGESGDLHFHDFHEVWFVVSGSATVICDKQIVVLNRGDALFTASGEEHQIVDVHESFTVVFASYKPQGKCRPGHLYRDDSDRA